MTKLFPAIKPYSSFRLPVGSRHEIYVEEVGNPKGKPIIFVHGGPGGGLDSYYRRFFDPDYWRVILFDQRGCGKSTPSGETVENTTFDLVSDMELIREKLNICSWHIFGGSWGSTLGLTYAICHPERVNFLILRGIFLLRKQEINWFYQDGAGRFFPEEWQKFIAPVPKSERSDLVLAYKNLLNSQDQNTVYRAAKAWSRWEAATSKLIPDRDLIAHFSQKNFSYAFARIENHFFINRGFFKSDNWILENIEKIKNISGVIVQGRYDMPCPPISAYELSQAWTSSKLIIVSDAGHSLSEPGIQNYLLKAVRECQG